MQEQKQQDDIAQNPPWSNDSASVRPSLKAFVDLPLKVTKLKS